MPFMPLNIVSLPGCSPNSDMENKFCRPQEHSIECKSLLHCYSAYLKRSSEIAAVFFSFRGWSAECWGGKAQEGAWSAAHITPPWINVFSGNLKAATLEIVLGENMYNRVQASVIFSHIFLDNNINGDTTGKIKGCLEIFNPLPFFPNDFYIIRWVTHMLYHYDNPISTYTVGH